MTVQGLIDLLSMLPNKLLPVLCAVDEEINGFIEPEFVVPQDRDDDDEPGPPRFVLIGTGSGHIFLEDVDVDGAWFKDHFGSREK